MEADRVDVIPQGIDDEFLSALPERVPVDGPLRLLFAGAFCRRKGGPVLAEAISRLDDVDWRLDLCGPIDPDAAAALDRLTADHRVTHHGMLPYSGLPALMASADVFVFPTLAEGSARVQFEALAAGCYLVTTPNGGSIVEDGEHGRLVAPGSATEIAEALREAAMDRPPGGAHRPAERGSRAPGLPTGAFRRRPVRALQAATAEEEAVQSKPLTRDESR